MSEFSLTHVWPLIRNKLDIQKWFKNVLNVSDVSLQLWENKWTMLVELYTFRLQ